VNPEYRIPIHWNFTRESLKPMNHTSVRRPDNKYQLVIGLVCIGRSDQMTSILRQTRIQFMANIFVMEHHKQRLDRGWSEFVMALSLTDRFRPRVPMLNIFKRWLTGPV
jgi:hypothetical protein